MPISSIPSPMVHLLSAVIQLAGRRRASCPRPHLSTEAVHPRPAIRVQPLIGTPIELTASAISTSTTSSRPLVNTRGSIAWTTRRLPRGTTSSISIEIECCWRASWLSIVMLLECNVSMLRRCFYYSLLLCWEIGWLSTKQTSTST